MRAPILAALAVAAIPATLASAENLTNLFTSLQVAPGIVSATEGTGFGENFEGFALGGAGQFGWTTNGAANIVDTGMAGFGSRSAAVSGSPDGVNAGNLLSPAFGPISFGTIAADILIDADDGTTFGFQSADSGVGFINTRVLFQPGGGIDVVQVSGGAGVIVGTTGSWGANVATQIGIEVLAGNILNVYQDGALIFSGHDIVQELAAGPGGLDSVGGLNFGVGNNSVIIMDNITDQLVPGPGALALFGVAGLAATRRRR